MSRVDVSLACVGSFWIGMGAGVLVALVDAPHERCVVTAERAMYELGRDHPIVVDYHAHEHPSSGFREWFLEEVPE